MLRTWNRNCMVCTVEAGLRVLSQVQLQNYRVLQFYIRKPAIQNVITVNILYTHIYPHIHMCAYTYMLHICTLLHLTGIVSERPQ